MSERHTKGATAEVACTTWRISDPLSNDLGFRVGNSNSSPPCTPTLVNLIPDSRKWRFELKFDH